MTTGSLKFTSSAYFHFIAFSGVSSGQNRQQKRIRHLKENYQNVGVGVKKDVSCKG